MSEVRRRGDPVTESRHSLHSAADVSGLVDDCAGCAWIARDPILRGSPELRRRLEGGDLRTTLDRRARAAIPGVDPLPDDDVELVGVIPRCDECGRATWSGHWPWCSSASASDRRDWERRDELRALRTIGRLS